MFTFVEKDTTENVCWEGKSSKPLEQCYKEMKDSPEVAMITAAEVWIQTICEQKTRRIRLEQQPLLAQRLRRRRTMFQQQRT
jgi:hypothetical protein